MKTSILPVCLLALFAGYSGAQDQGTAIRLTDKVLVKDVMPLGVHLVTDNPYNSPIKKMRVEENFEGTIYRAAYYGPGAAEDGMFAFSQLSRWGEEQKEALLGGTYRILSGPDRGRTGSVRLLEDREDPHPAVDRKLLFIGYDRPYRPHSKLNGVLLERELLDRGRNPWLKKPKSWKDPKVPELDERFCSPENGLVQGDTPPGSFGSHSFCLRGAKEKAFVGFIMIYSSPAPLKGIWKTRFWAKSAGGAPKLRVGPGQGGTSFLSEVRAEGQPQEVAVGREWKRHELTFVIDVEPGILSMQFEVDGGDVLIDDVEAWAADDTNPTPFRDEFVEVLQELKPGVVRLLHNMGDTMLNTIRPRLRSVAMGGYRRKATGLHEFYTLCEHIQTAAWQTLPGTLVPEEMDQFMEYVGAPPDVGLGKLRAEMGHPRPWTETLPAIWFQFGNEVITFNGTGAPVPDYWREMIERAKNSPYYKPNLIFVVDHQTGSGNVLEYAPNADALCVNTYALSALHQKAFDTIWDSKEKFYRFVFAERFHALGRSSHAYSRHYVHAIEREIELSVYEGGNYHTTFGDASAERRNRMICGLAGGLSATHSSLFMLKTYGARSQNSFNLSQHSFSPGGAFGDFKGRVRVWGGLTGLLRPQERRWRPRLLALKTANQVMGGDLVQTVHEGADPRFSATGPFKHVRRGPMPEPETVGNLPVINSYGFKEGNRRGLILVSLDVSEPRTVRIEFDGAAAGDAQTWTLTADDIEATNEPDWTDEPQVEIQTGTIPDFKSGHQLMLPPFSMIALEWGVTP